MDARTNTQAHPAAYAEAFGAHAEKVVDPAALPEAMERCVKAVRGGRSALLHVRATPL